MIPVVDLTRVIGWIKTAGADAFKWLIFRAFIISVITILLPIAIYNGWLLIQKQIFSFISSHTGSDSFAAVSFQIAGVGAWLANCLQFPACLSVVMSGAAVKFVLSFFKG